MENQTNSVPEVQVPKNTGKKIIIWIVGIIILLFIITFFLPTILGLFAKDVAVVDMTGVTLNKVTPKDSDNSFFDLQKVEKVLSVPKEKTSLVPKYADGSTWDEADIKDLLSKNTQALDYFKLASQKGVYQDINLADPSTVSPATILGNLSSVRTVGQLSVIKARLLLKQGKIDDAVNESFKSIKVGQQLGTSQSFMIQYLVSLSLKRGGLTVLQEIINTTNLSLDQMIDINARLNENYDNGVGLANAFKLENISRNTVLDSLKYNTDFSYKNFVAEKDANIFTKLSLGNPKNSFYFKPNGTRAIAADYVRKQVSLINEPCSVSLKKTTEKLLPSLGSPKLLVTENAIGKLLVDGVAELTAVYQKRCETNFLISANKALIAIKGYKNAEGKYPIDWNDLIISGYIAGAPKDPFTNEGLKYSFEKKIIYSVGKKGVDVGGSEGDFSTVENPTVKIGF